MKYVGGKGQGYKNIEKLCGEKLDFLEDIWKYKGREVFAAFELLLVTKNHWIVIAVLLILKIATPQKKATPWSGKSDSPK